MSKDFCNECGDNACMKTLGLSTLLKRDWQSNAAAKDAEEDTMTPVRQADLTQSALLETTPGNSSSLLEDLNSEGAQRAPSPKSGSPAKPAAKGLSPSGRVSLGKVESLFYEGNPVHIPFSGDMFMYDKNNVITYADSAAIKNKAVENRESLLGYLVRVEVASKEGLYLVTGVRKQRGSATEYCLISRTERVEKDPRTPTISYAEVWITLQRAEGKSGSKFEVIRNSTVDL